MKDLKFYNLNEIEYYKLNRVVILAKYKNKWIFCKQKTRDTWEIPGGHIEDGETWLEAASRELYEETGAIKIDIKPICIYLISKYGILCYADILELGPLPESEIDKIDFFEDIPKNLTYPWHLEFFNKL